MYNGYDENLAENPFYIELKKKFSYLFEHCINEGWVICVPRLERLTSRQFTIEDFSAHILVPSDELPETHFNTLTEKQAIVLNNVITIDVPNGLPIQSHILYEEAFYTEDCLKYKVWCIEKPLEPSSNDSKSFMNEQLSTVNDCINLLWTQAAGRQVLDEIECCTQKFLEKNSPLPVALAPLRDSICALYTQCIQIALQNKRLREKTKSSKQSLESLKVAVECYMQHLIFDSLFKTICTCCSYEDSHLNKRIRNLSELQLKDLDIKKSLFHSMPKAKQVLSKLNSCKTVLEKLTCLKQAINTFQATEDYNKTVMLTADDMLPALVFLVIKSNLPNWSSQLIFMKEFRFSKTSKTDGDEDGFLITTLEAVIQHIQSDALTGSPQPEAYYYETDATEDQIASLVKRRSSLTESMSTNDTINDIDESLEYIFELIKSSNNEQVKIILERNKQHLAKIGLDENIILNERNFLTDEDDSDTILNPKLCHPLCGCYKCCSKVSRRLLKTCPTVSSRDGFGMTPLHVASIHGKAVIVETLLELGAEINSTDLNECTPLHYSAAKGHQNVLLLLLHLGARVNCINIDKNTALHMAVNNGHINCVKALIYFSAHSRKKLNINCRNEHGSTPLHLASNWGYEGIAKVLIENGALTSLQNKYKKTALDYAHNLRIMQVLKICKPNIYNYIHFSDSDGNYLRISKSELKKLNLSNDPIISKEYNAVESLKLLERIFQAISYGDVKLACFYLNINYFEYKNKINSNVTCHPLCECINCKKGLGVLGTRSSDIDVNLCDSKGSTALHCAAQYGLDELCKILIISKADVNRTNKKGQTSLHLAAIYNKSHVIKLLLDNGTEIDIMDNFGNTALHEASNAGNIGATKMLLSYKPNLSIRNCAEKTALDIAKENVYLTVIDVIENQSRIF